VNNKIIIGAILVVIVIGGFLYFTQKQYQTSQPQPSTQASSMQQAATQPAQTGTEAGTVTISNFAFNPATLTIKQGTKVTWTNQDSAAHKIKSATFNSGDINQGEKFEFTFDSKGSFDYSCSIHPSMTGKIVVE